MAEKQDERLIELTKAQKELAELDRKRADLRAQIEALQSPRQRQPSPASRGSQLALPRPIPTTPAAKTDLFRRLFRGRPDVYPTRFVSRKTGRPGYAPACSNKFVHGVCGLPRIKCSECPNQAFLPMDDTAILDHLRGRHVMGVYPLLHDESCWFLAADFDQADWLGDTSAFVQTCREKGVSCSIERSRSGNGAHAWIFFSAPVQAHLARALGCFLLTETMARRHQLGMASYDRLFPSQDTLPRGGFGNLIALPLSSKPARRATPRSSTTTSSLIRTSGATWLPSR